MQKKSFFIRDILQKLENDEKCNINNPCFKSPTYQQVSNVFKLNESNLFNNKNLNKLQSQLNLNSKLSLEKHFLFKCDSNKILFNWSSLTAAATNTKTNSLKSLDLINDNEQQTSFYLANQYSNSIFDKSNHHNQQDNYQINIFNNKNNNQIKFLKDVEDVNNFENVENSENEDNKNNEKNENGEENNEVVENNNNENNDEENKKNIKNNKINFFKEIKEKIDKLKNPNNNLESDFLKCNSQNYIYFKSNDDINLTYSIKNKLSKIKSTNNLKKKKISNNDYIFNKEKNDRKKRKNRRNRTVFTELQLMGLERRFDSQKYLSTPDRAELANALGLSQLQVKTWYQNRRMKWKKQVMQGGCLVAPTKPKGRPKKNSIPSLGLTFNTSTLLSAVEARKNEQRFKDLNTSNTKSLVSKFFTSNSLDSNSSFLLKPNKKTSLTKTSSIYSNMLNLVSKVPIYTDNLFSNTNNDLYKSDKFNSIQLLKSSSNLSKNNQILINQFNNESSIQNKSIAKLNLISKKVNLLSF